MKSISLIPFLFVLLLGGSHAFCIYNEAAFDIHVQSSTIFSCNCEDKNGHYKKCRCGDDDRILYGMRQFGFSDYGLKIPPGGREVSETLTTE